MLLFFGSSCPRRSKASAAAETVLSDNCFGNSNISGSARTQPVLTKLISGRTLLRVADRDELCRELKDAQENRDWRLRLAQC